MKGEPHPVAWGYLKGPLGHAPGHSTLSQGDLSTGARGPALELWGWELVRGSHALAELGTELSIQEGRAGACEKLRYVCLGRL